MIPRSALPLDDQAAAHVFTGVSCLGQSGPGGWAVIIRSGDATQELGGHEATTSANRLHLLAAQRGLEAAPTDRTVHLYTPSDYVAQGAKQWVKNWAARGWRTKDDQPVKHRELWQAIVAASQTRIVQWH
ncbi:MAG TPA: ribonuclease H, partial [Anaerolineae bacterium]|nr:ribonuclease H [Anaerolineae bacterium]